MRLDCGSLGRELWLGFFSVIGGLGHYQASREFYYKDSWWTRGGGKTFWWRYRRSNVTVGLGLQFPSAGELWAGFACVVAQRWTIARTVRIQLQLERSKSSRTCKHVLQVSRCCNCVVGTASAGSLGGTL